MGIKPTCVLALDQGTTSSRAILFDAAGLPLGIAQEEFPQHAREQRGPDGEDLGVVGGHPPASRFVPRERTGGAECGVERPGVVVGEGPVEELVGQWFVDPFAGAGHVRSLPDRH